MSKNEFMKYYKSPSFSLQIKQGNTDTFLKLVMHTTIVSTNHIPQTHSFLKLHSPSVLTTECFNPNNYPFCVEVKNTEMGHLFEHMLLDEMRRLQEANGLHNVFNGETSWDYSKLGYGVFSIWIDSGYSKEPIMHTALHNTIFLFEKLLSSHNSSSQSFLDFLSL